MSMKCDRCDKRAWYIGKHIQVCRDHHSAHLLEMKDSHIAELTEQLEMARELLDKSRARSNYPTDKWNKQRNDFYEKIREEE